MKKTDKTDFLDKYPDKKDNSIKPIYDSISTKEDVKRPEGKPHGADKKVTLDSGRVVFFRKATMKHQRMATEYAAKQHNQDAFQLALEFLWLLFIELRRVNGEAVNVSSKDELFEKVLTLEEANQLIFAADSIIGLQKKTPKVESL